MKNKLIRGSKISLVDNLIFEIKELMLNSTIKIPKQYRKNETRFSSKNASIYISCIRGTGVFNSYNYTYDDFYECLKFTYNEDKIQEIYSDKENWNKNVPDNLKYKVIERYRKRFIEDYEEYNQYYRELNGLAKLDLSDAIYITEEEIGDIPGVNINNPVHMMSVGEQSILYSFKIIDDLKNQYGYKYLSYLGSNKKEIYQSRMAEDFSLLGIESEVSDELVTRFKEKYELNRLYTLKHIYSDAYKLESENYDEFIAMTILTQTGMDILNEITDIYNKRELFDLKTVKLFFNSIGVDYYANIPLKFQMNLVRNFHRLLINKSNSVNLEDILTIFNMKNIDIFKYYLSKVRRKDYDGNLMYTGDDKVDLELKFLRVPFDENPDDYIDDLSNYITYNTATSGDPYWNGERSYEEVYDDHLNQDFNILRSKYLSIDVLNDISEMNFNMIYFYNMLFDSKVLEDNLYISVPFLSQNTNFKIVDLLSFLFSISRIYMGFEDNLIDLTEKVLYIRGFNFDVDMDKLNDILMENETSWDKLGITKFINPDTEIITYKQLLSILNNNILTLNGLTDLINNAENKYEYDLLNQIYEALFTMELSSKFYDRTIGYYPESNKEFVSKRNGILYDKIVEIESIKEKPAREEAISLIIEHVVFAIQSQISDLDFTYIFKDVPTVSSTSVQDYIMLIANFFKSFKTQMMEVKTSMHLADKLMNKVNIVDLIKLVIRYEINDFVDLEDLVKFITTAYNNDGVSTLEKVYFNIVGQKYSQYYREKVSIDEVFKFLMKYEYKDRVLITEKVNLYERYPDAFKVIDVQYDYKDDDTCNIHIKYSTNIIVNTTFLRDVKLNSNGSSFFMGMDDYNLTAVDNILSLNNIKIYNVIPVNTSKINFTLSFTPQKGEIVSVDGYELTEEYESQVMEHEDKNPPRIKNLVHKNLNHEYSSFELEFDQKVTTKLQTIGGISLIHDNNEYEIHRKNCSLKNNKIIINSIKPFEITGVYDVKVDFKIKYTPILNEIIDERKLSARDIYESPIVTHEDNDSPRVKDLIYNYVSDDNCKLDIVFDQDVTSTDNIDGIKLFKNGNEYPIDKVNCTVNKDRIEVVVNDVFDLLGVTKNKVTFKLEYTPVRGVITNASGLTNKNKFISTDITHKDNNPPKAIGATYKYIDEETCEVDVEFNQQIQLTTHNVSGIFALYDGISYPLTNITTKLARDKETLLISNIKLYEITNAYGNNTLEFKLIIEPVEGEIIDENTLPMTKRFESGILIHEDQSPPSIVTSTYKKIDDVTAEIKATFDQRITGPIDIEGFQVQAENEIGWVKLNPKKVKINSDEKSITLTLKVYEDIEELQPKNFRISKIDNDNSIIYIDFNREITYGDKVEGIMIQLEGETTWSNIQAREIKLEPNNKTIAIKINPFNDNVVYNNKVDNNTVELTINFDDKIAPVDPITGFTFNQLGSNEWHDITDAKINSDGKSINIKFNPFNDTTTNKRGGTNNEKN